MTVVATIVPYLDRATLTDHIRAGYPTYPQGRIDTAANTYLACLTVVGILGVAGWVWAVRAVHLGKRWSRALATAMFTLGTAVALTTLLIRDTSGDPGLPPLFGWVASLPCLPGLLAVILLWRRSVRG